MALTRNIGKNTLGDNSKMSVRLHSYNMSNHDLSFVFRNTQSPGTLVPFMKIVGQKGDVFDIQMINKTLTHPTVGPLFGSYKLQHFIFSCPIRLYNSWLHNNRTGIGMKMSEIKLPMMKVETLKSSVEEGTNKWSIKGKPYSSSSLMNYLGFKGKKSTAFTGDFPNPTTKVNALPYLMYWDIFKNYFANKQEDIFYMVGTGNTVREFEASYNNNTKTYENDVNITYGYVLITKTTTIKAIVSEQIPDNWEEFWKNTNLTTYNSAGQMVTYTIDELATNINQQTITTNKWGLDYGGKIEKIGNVNQNGVTLKQVPLENLETIRNSILQKPGNEQLIVNDLSYEPFMSMADPKQWTTPQYQLAVKTYDSDIFQNWINTEWIDGENGISAITAVDVADGKLTMDSLNLAQKVYNMLNRIAVSGGTYRDWLETVYTTGNYIERPETPVFEGGMTQYIEFDEVVSQSATENEPLGTLAGRGKNTRQKGDGRVHFKLTEPSYVIGLCAITPMIDYSQGNDWDMLNLETMDDLHKPALDGIGYEDSLEAYRAWWSSVTDLTNAETNYAAGKTVAWINYMTNFNKTFGNFASGESESFMCLNRNYEFSEETGLIEDLTTYIDPSKHNEIFADTNIDAMNFWVQTACDIEVRRMISAKQIPNL